MLRKGTLALRPVFVRGRSERAQAFRRAKASGGDKR